MSYGSFVIIIKPDPVKINRQHGKKLKMEGVQVPKKGAYIKYAAETRNAVQRPAD
jgi:hypothetical protein